MVHTRFFFTKTAAQNAFDEMKGEMEGILNLIPTVEEATEANTRAISEALLEFVERFP